MKSKYNAQKTIFDGIKFDSKKESEYYKTLLLLKRAANISDRVINIELQPRFDYSIEYKANDNVFKKKAFYKADFKVFYADGRISIVDVKGFKTATYKRKKKVIEALYNLKIIEV